MNAAIWALTAARRTRSRSSSTCFEKIDARKGAGSKRIQKTPRGNHFMIPGTHSLLRKMVHRCFLRLVSKVRTSQRKPLPHQRHCFFGAMDSPLELRVFHSRQNL